MSFFDLGCKGFKGRFFAKQGPKTCRFGRVLPTLAPKAVENSMGPMNLSGTIACITVGEGCSTAAHCVKVNAARIPKALGCRMLTSELIDDVQVL